MTHSVLFGGKQITGFLFRRCCLSDVWIRVHWFIGIKTHPLFRHILIKISRARLAGYFSHDCLKKIPKYYALFCFVHSQAVSRNLLPALSLVIGFVFDAAGDQGARGRVSYVDRAIWSGFGTRGGGTTEVAGVGCSLIYLLQNSSWVTEKKRTREGKREQKVRAEPFWLVWVSENKRNKRRRWGGEHVKQEMQWETSRWRRKNIQKRKHVYRLWGGRKREREKNKKWGRE